MNHGVAGPAEEPQQLRNHIPLNPDLPLSLPSHGKPWLLKKRRLWGEGPWLLQGKPSRDDSADPGRASDDPHSRSFTPA